MLLGAVRIVSINDTLRQRRKVREKRGNRSLHASILKKLNIFFTKQLPLILVL